MSIFESQTAPTDGGETRPVLQDAQASAKRGTPRETGPELKCAELCFARNPFAPNDLPLMSGGCPLFIGVLMGSIWSFGQ